LKSNLLTIPAHRFEIGAKDEEFLNPFPRIPIIGVFSAINMEINPANPSSNRTQKNKEI